MTDLKPLTAKQQALIIKYNQARIAWECGTSDTFEEDVNAYTTALDACLDAGFDPFHHPIPQ